METGQRPHSKVSKRSYVQDDIYPKQAYIYINEFQSTTNYRTNVISQSGIINKISNRLWKGPSLQTGKSCNWDAEYVCAFKMHLQHEVFRACALVLTNVHIQFAYIILNTRRWKLYTNIQAHYVVHIISIKWIDDALPNTTTEEIITPTLWCQN